MRVFRGKADPEAEARPRGQLNLIRSRGKRYSGGANRGRPLPRLFRKIVEFAEVGPRRGESRSLLGGMLSRPCESTPLGPSRMRAAKAWHTLPLSPHQRA